jgi:two-component system heavy metal sensor histidine kinase CusS
MSSKIGPEGASGTWSLAARLTVWQAGSAFTLVLAATGYLYWASVSGLDREDDQLLGDRVRVLRTLLRNHPGETDSIRREIEEEWEGQQRTRIHIRILTEAGQVLVETPGMNRLLPPAAFPDPQTEPEQGADARSGSGEVYRVLAAHAAAAGPESSAYAIQVAMDRSLESELQAGYRRNLALVLGTALVLCGVTGYLIARRSMRPIRGISETAGRIRPTNLGERILADGLPAELFLLAATFNQMLDRLEQSFARLARFCADIAHELRTPVYALRGEIEVALSKPRSPEEYREVLGSSLDECGRLTRLIDRLLFLARAEHPATQVATEPCDVVRELATVSDFYEAAAGEAQVRLAVAPTGPVLADLDRTLFQRAVGNLVANALAHTPAGGVVTLTAAGGDTATRVEVTDTGCGIPSSHLPHVFDRFYRVDPTRPSDHGRVGLGLAIVRSIMELHGGSAEIASEVGRGTRVALVFPRRSPQAVASVGTARDPRGTMKKT